MLIYGALPKGSYPSYSIPKYGIPGGIEAVSIDIPAGYGYGYTVERFVPGRLVRVRPVQKVKKARKR